MLDIVSIHIYLSFSDEIYNRQSFLTDNNGTEAISSNTYSYYFLLFVLLLLRNYVAYTGYYVVRAQIRYLTMTWKKRQNKK